MSSFLITFYWTVAALAFVGVLVGVLPEKIF
jgi:hypothetical protein